MNYFDFRPGDFYATVQGLDLEGQGIFVALISRLMTTEKPIKTQWVYLGFPKSAQEKAMAILENFFEEVEDGWILQPYWDQVARYQENSRKNRENGKKGGRPRKQQLSQEGQTENPVGLFGLKEVTHGKADGKATNNQEPITNNQEIDIDTRDKPARPSKPKLVKPEGVSDQVFDEWQAFKRKLCKGCTQRMVDAIAREAEKAGMTVEQAMTYQLEKGWKGFEADWVRNAQPKKRPTDPQHGIGVCQPLPEEEVHWLTDEDRAESLRQMEAEGCAPF